METAGVTPKIALKNILFATDFEASAKRALPFARLFAEHYGAKLHAAHVIPLAAYATARYEPVESILKETRDYASYALNQLLEPLRRIELPCDTLLAEGEVVEELETLAREYSADLIVAGTSSRSGLGKVFLGSVAEELIRDATCPVLTVGPRVSRTEEVAMHSIACAVDFSPVSSLAAKFAVLLAHDFQAPLSLVHVLEGVLNDWPQAVRVTEDRIRTMIPLDCDRSYGQQVLVKTGPIADRILRVTTDLEADLIVMGVRGAGAFAHTASHLGSIAHKVISLATCPVMTLGLPKVCG